MIFKGFIVTKMLSTHTHVHTSFSVSVSVYDYEFLSLSISLSLSLPVRMWVCVCVCVCVPEWIYGWNAPVNGGLPCKQRPYSVVCQFGANRVGEGGGRLHGTLRLLSTWKLFSIVLPSLVSLKFSINSAVSLLYGVGVLHDEFMLKCRFERKKMH